ncbi:carboxylesterase 4A-like [Bicyclus anynana]|uniref:Carboxylesterase 4A-like n=1 Tax=Bicyclus anynana TaxID=110368 RepID=A0A6J1N6V2_BICAN|nr:carboxylesterase 4A-like [Bicyclus anynana]
MGESAGGASVEYHLLSQHEKLFNQAITQSGTTYLPGLLEEDEKDKPLKIAAQLGFETQNINDAVAFLAKTDAHLVIAATTALGIKSRPCIEKEFDNIDNIITDHPLNLAMPKAKNINALVGFNNKEQLFKYNLLQADQFAKLNNVFEESLQQRFIYDDNFKSMEDIVRRFYIGDEVFNEALKDNLTDFQSDYDFAYPIQQSLKRYLDSGANNVFQYVFSYSGGRNFVKKRLNVTIPGAAHADELGYLYDLTTETQAPSAEDQLVIERITALWTNFVKYG